MTLKQEYILGLVLFAVFCAVMWKVDDGMHQIVLSVTEKPRPTMEAAMCPVETRMPIDDKCQQSYPLEIRKWSYIWSN